MAWLNVAWELVAQGFVVEDRVHVGQHGAPRPDPRRPDERLREMAVRRMWLAAEAIDDPDLDAGERRESFLVELDDVRRVAEGADAEAERLAEPMILLERRHPHAGDLERPGDFVWRQHGLVERPAGLDRPDRVPEALLDRLERRGIRPDRDRPAHGAIDRAQIVDAVEMVGMGMGVENGVEPAYPGVDELLAAIGRRIDEDRRACRLDEDRAA